MDKEEEKKKIDDLFAPHDLDLEGFSDAVKARFEEATCRTDKQNEYMLFPDGCELGMIGTMVNEHGIEVPVYERGLSIRSKMKSYGPDWAKEMGVYTEEQLSDPEYMELLPHLPLSLQRLTTRLQSCRKLSQLSRARRSNLSHNNSFVAGNQP